MRRKLVLAATPVLATALLAGHCRAADAITRPIDIPGVRNFACVSPHLYRGEQPTAEGIAELQKLGVKTIVNLRAFHSDRVILRNSALQYLHIRCHTWKPEEEDVVTFLKVVSDPANQPVFVHCWQGSDRTGMMVLAYRVTQQGWTIADARKELPNFGFHPVWKRIRRYVEAFDAPSVGRKVAAAKATRIDRVN